MTASVVYSEAERTMSDFFVQILSAILDLFFSAKGHRDKISRVVLVCAIFFLVGIAILAYVFFDT